MAFSLCSDFRCFLGGALASLCSFCGNALAYPAGILAGLLAELEFDDGHSGPGFELAGAGAVFPDLRERLLGPGCSRRLDSGIGHSDEIYSLSRPWSYSHLCSFTEKIAPGVGRRRGCRGALRCLGNDALFPLRRIAFYIPAFPGRQWRSAKIGSSEQSFSSSGRCCTYFGLIGADSVIYAALAAASCVLACDPSILTSSMSRCPLLRRERV